MSYNDFIKNKHKQHGYCGFDVPLDDLPPFLKDWQKVIVQWALLKGRAALFESCGLGKTCQQLVWADYIHKKENKPIIILAPLAVAPQTVKEGVKFGIDVNIVRENDDIVNGINITNYERLEKIDASQFVAVVLDESSIIKSLMGKTKMALIRAFSGTKYRLCCTATPSPNDIVELGSHSDFLGVMPYQEMLTRFFVNDSFNVGTWRLKGHATDRFWEWVSSWAVCLSVPSDIGFDDDGYILPEKHTIIHTVKRQHDFKNGLLIAKVDNSVTGIRQELKLTFEDRCKVAADIANNTTESVVLWCETNAESKLLTKLIPDAVEVEGGMPVDMKVKNLTSFSDGTARVIVTKPKLAGFGLNWQHCNISVCVGLSYSFEQRYQAIRRLWRFGQEREVYDHICMGENEGRLYEVQQKKQSSHEEMGRQISAFINSRQSLNMDNSKIKLENYQTQQNIKLPSFI